MYKKTCTQKGGKYKSEFHLKFGLIYKYQINAPLIKKPIRNVTIKNPAKLLAMPVLQKKLQ